MHFCCCAFCGLLPGTLPFGRFTAGVRMRCGAFWRWTYLPGFLLRACVAFVTALFPPLVAGCCCCVLGRCHVNCFRRCYHHARRFYRWRRIVLIRYSRTGVRSSPGLALLYFGRVLLPPRFVDVILYIYLLLPVCDRVDSFSLHYGLLGWLHLWMRLYSTDNVVAGVVLGGLDIVRQSIYGHSLLRLYRAGVILLCQRVVYRYWTCTFYIPCRAPCWNIEPLFSAFVYQYRGRDGPSGSPCLRDHSPDVSPLLHGGSSVP